MPVFSLQGFSFGTSANPFDGRRRSVRTPGALALLEAPDSVNTPRLPTLWEEPQLVPFDREGGAHPPYATKITHTFRIRAISNKPVQNWHTDARVKVRKLHVSVSGYELI